MSVWVRLLRKCHINQGGWVLRYERGDLTYVACEVAVRMVADHYATAAFWG